MPDLSFNNSLSLDMGLSGISYQSRQNVKQSLPERREIAPAEESVKNHLETLLSTPNLSNYVTAQLRPVLSNNDMLTPARFASELNRACAFLDTAKQSNPRDATVLQRAARTLREEAGLRDLVTMYRSALYQG
ncbi:type III secretion apparatus assembly protein SctX [Achromobacter marplatensis]|uniref:type III secretion apparatus assembly protein SctX n=1 Tax=Achromobacter marplatensis TaxID=470868 RepID=UPI0039F65E52